MLTGNRQPDHSRISEFHRSNLEAPSGLFVQILRFCQEAGMVSLDHVALDDIKVQDKRQRGRPSNQPGSRALGQGQLKVGHKVTSLAQIVEQDCDLDQLSVTVRACVVPPARARELTVPAVLLPR